jgi:hypothetical protein
MHYSLLGLNKGLIKPVRENGLLRVIMLTNRYKSTLEISETDWAHFVTIPGDCANLRATLSARAVRPA